MDSLDVPPSRPPPPPPKRLSRPKITLQIPESAAPMTPRGPPTGTSVYWGNPRFHGKPPTTPASHISDPRNPYFSPFAHMYHSKASEFMFKQFEGFKDFTMNTAKSGLSAGEKTAFWFYNRLRSLSKKWFTHLFLTMCLVLYSVIGAAVFMAIEGPHEERVDKDLAGVRLDLAVKIEEVWREENMEDKQVNTTAFLSKLEQELATYELNFTEAMKQINNNDTRNKTWGFWNSMFYAGTIYTTIDICYDPDVIKKYLVRRRFYDRCFHKTVMSEVGNEEKSRLTLKIPIIKAETETQTLGHLVSRSPDKAPDNMEAEQKMSIRKRRNLSKNRPQATRQREKTPEPGRTLVPHEDTTSDEEDIHPVRNSREIEADNTYEEMRRLVQEKASVKDPIYDINTDEVMEARAIAANERRRRSISPFALPDNDAPCKLERKGSFIDPTNKLLSTQYFASPKEDEPSRRSSLTIEPPKDRSSISPPGTASPKDKEPPYPIPLTPKKLEEMVYADDVREQKVSKDKPRQLRSPIAKDKEGVFTFEEKDVKPSPKATSPKSPDTPTPGELVTKVIEVERTPSRKLTQESKPVVEVRERIVRTPSKKLTADVKPVIKQQPPKPVKDDPKLKIPPVKPARSKSATRFGNKTSESEMSEDQLNLLNAAAAPKRKAVPTPRRFMKSRSPRANRSQSVNRADELQVASKSGMQMTKTAKDIIELLEKRARSLSISKDDPRLPVEYQYSRNLQTPNKTPVSRTSRGISCPKTIQIISGSEILSGIKPTKKVEAPPQRKRTQSSGYIDASQSEYTSSCYSSSPSENEFNFDLSERTAELTRKLNLLSQDSEKSMDALKVKHNTSLVNVEYKQEATSVLRKRSVAETRNGVKNERRKSLENKKANKKADVKTKQLPKSKWKFIANWQEFKMEHKSEYESLFLLRNRCICDLIILIIMCGLGGLMFKSLEGSFENAYKCGSRGVKRDFLESLWRGSHYLREEDWKSMARKKLYEFENQLLTAHEAGVTSYSGQRSWNFMNSFVYCLTLITTIGYGHISPKTTYGRVATIVYAVIGIPLFLIVLADFGKLFTRIIKFFWSFIRRFYYTRSCKKVRRTGPMQEVMKGLNIVYDVVRRPSQIFSEEDLECPQPPQLQRKPSDAPPPLPPKPKQVIDAEADTEPDTPAPSVFEIDDEFNVPISVALFILVVYIIIGGAGFSMWEQWNFFESFYFVFISMSTIGLGDLVPNHPIFMMASILYLVFGLALTSMCINVVQEKLSDTFKKASAKLGATIGLKVAEEDGSLVPITPPPTEIAPVHKPKAVAPKPKESDENDSKPKESNENESKPNESNENDSKPKESDENDSKNR